MSISKLLCMTIVFWALLLGLGSTVTAEVTLELYPEKISNKDNAIKLSFNGKIYQESWWFDEVMNNKFSAQADERFIITAFTTNQKGTLTEILNLWPDDERADTKNTFSSSLALDGSQGYLQKINNVAFLAKIAYGPYTIFFVQYSSREFGNEIDEYVITSDGGRYYMTNKLKEDPVLAYLDQKIKTLLPLKVRK